MDREQFVNEVQKEIKQIHTQLLKFIDINYAISLLKWVLELITKNYIIKCYPNKERVQRRRGEVYWIDFGVNIGSEFNYPHFCVVIKEFESTAIVIPLSSVKEEDSSWKSQDNLIFNIGVLKDIPDNMKECYAMVNQIRSVSKQRLSPFVENDKRIKIKLDNDQLNIIDGAIKKLCKS